MGIAIGGCILSIDLSGVDPRDYDSLWQMLMEYWFSLGWDGKATI